MAGEFTSIQDKGTASTVKRKCWFYIHAWYQVGGDWELGVRAVRPFQNVFLEFSGSDPHSGQADFTVSEVGEDRLVWGEHGPSEVLKGGLEGQAMVRLSLLKLGVSRSFGTFAVASASGSVVEVSTARG